MYKHMVGRAASFVSPFYSILLGDFKLHVAYTGFSIDSLYSMNRQRFKGVESISDKSQNQE